MRGRLAKMLYSEYRAAPGENISRLKLFADSPLAYKVNAQKHSHSLNVGTFGHLAILEPDRFRDEVVVFDGDKRTKAWKEFKAANIGKSILGRDDYDDCTGMAASVHAHPRASRYFKTGQSEVTIFWTHRFGVECKSRLDWMSDDLIVDPKTSGRSITPRRFGYQCADLFYYAQMAFYHDAAEALDGRKRKVVLLAIQQKAPYDVVPYVLSEDDLAAGRARYESWLSTLIRCQEANHWPGICSDEMPLSLPDFVFNEWDCATTVPAPSERGNPEEL